MSLFRKPRGGESEGSVRLSPPNPNPSCLAVAIPQCPWLGRVTWIGERGGTAGSQVSQSRSLEMRAGGFRGPALSRGTKGHIELGGKARRLEAPGFQLYPGLIGRCGENRKIQVPNADH